MTGLGKLKESITVIGRIKEEKKQEAPKEQKPEQPKEAKPEAKA